VVHAWLCSFAVQARACLPEALTDVSWVPVVSSIAGTISSCFSRRVRTCLRADSVRDVILASTAASAISSSVAGP